MSFHTFAAHMIKDFLFKLLTHLPVYPGPFIKTHKKRPHNGLLQKIKLVWADFLVLYHA